MNEEELREWVTKDVAPYGLNNIAAFQATIDHVKIALDADTSAAFMECGVYHGAHPAIMAQTCRMVGEERTIWLADSFQGIPKAGPRDAEDIAPLVGRGAGPSGVSVASKAMVEERIRTWGLEGYPFRFLEGWFTDTLPGCDVGPLALLRIDVDLYESTKECLEHLYEKVVPGGVVVIDDWCLQGVRNAVEEHVDVEVNHVAGTWSPAWWVKGRDV